jgi:biotin synthase-related radical SAM superfamily protein
MSQNKDLLYQELLFKARVSATGINVKPNIFKHLALGSEYMEQVHGLAEADRHIHVGIDFPCYFYSPNGFTYHFVWDLSSPVSIEYNEDGRYYLYDQGKEVFPIEFAKRPKYYGLKTSDGVEMSHIANFSPGNTVRAAYSNECSLKEKGLDCYFCNANATKDTYAEKENIKWKTPKQIGETVAAAFRHDGAKHIQLTGGFIPERREVEYYLDVAEAIQEHTGQRNFNGNACVGAPQDIKIIDKYKEAGFQTVAINLELWDKNFFKALCPGKEQECGGWEHWVEALEYAASVFGFGYAEP